VIIKLKIFLIEKFSLPKGKVMVKPTVCVYTKDGTDTHYLSIWKTQGGFL